MTTGLRGRETSALTGPVGRSLLLYYFMLSEKYRTNKPLEHGVAKLSVYLVLTWFSTMEERQRRM